MKTYQEFINESSGMTIEDLNLLANYTREEIVKKLNIPLAVVQKSIVYMDQPFPHVHCQKAELDSGLGEKDKFLSDEVCGVFSAMCKEKGLKIVNVKKGDPHGKPGDILAIL